MRPWTAMWLLTAVSATAAGFLATGWVRSYDPISHRPVDLRIRNTRYSLRSERGVLMVLTPPATPFSRGPSADATRRWLRALSNDHVGWRMVVWRDGDIHRDTIYAVRALPLDGPLPSLLDGMSLQARLGVLTAPETTRLLLDALDDPNRFAAAHVALCAMYRGSSGHDDNRQFSLGGEWIVQQLDGLQVKLRPPRSAATQPVIVTSGDPSRVRIDPAQLPRIRDQWRRRFDTRVATLRYEVLVETSMLPALAGWVWLWRRARACKAALRRGLCPVCGYDLRGGHRRCPECGLASERTSECTDDGAGAPTAPLRAERPVKLAAGSAPLAPGTPATSGRQT